MLYVIAVAISQEKRARKFDDNEIFLFPSGSPSTTREKYEATGDQEYHSAEAAGRDNPGKCETLFSECDHNLLEYFTEINTSEEAMEHPGLYHWIFSALIDKSRHEHAQAKQKEEKIGPHEKPCSSRLRR